MNWIDPTKDPRWDPFVAAHPEATVFHTSAWAEVLISTYGYRPRYLVVDDRTGRIGAALPLFLISSRLTGRRLVCLPFSDECWPLVTSAEDAMLLLEAARQIVADEGAEYLEVRGWPAGAPPAESGLVGHTYYLRHRLRFDSDPAQFRQALNRKIRYNIHKAERLGVLGRRAETEDDFRAYGQLDLMTRRRHGVPPHPWKLFQSIYQVMVRRGLAFLLLAEWKGSVAAGIVFFAYGEILYGKYKASDPRFSECCANDLLDWMAIEQTCRLGYRVKDMGRSNPEHAGLLASKRHWGAEETSLPYYYYPAVRGMGAVEVGRSQVRAIQSVVRRLPGPLLRMAGDLLYRHMG